MKIKLFLITIFYVSVFISCSDNKQDTSIVLVQTTDVHGNIFPYDFINGKESNNSLASVSTYLKQLRSEYQNAVVLLDNGDFFQGQPSVYYYNFEETSGIHLGSKVMNYMQYDAMTVGNHDIEGGHELYDKVSKEINAPWLAANAINTKTGEPYFNPYTIIERKGIRIAVLGLITPAIPEWLPENIWQGMEFNDMIESAQKWIKIIYEKESPDLVVGLFHAGVDYTYNNQTKDTYKNENATQLVAEQVPGFDIVLAGHDHKNHNKTIINVAGDTVYLLDPMSGAKAVSSLKVDFKYNKADKLWKKHITPNIVFMNDYEPNIEFVNAFKEEFEAIKNYVDREVGELKQNLSTKHAYFGNSTFIDLIHKVQLENSNAQVSFTAPLSFNSTVPKGVVRVRDLFKLYKYENLLYTIELTGNEIDQFLEYSAGLWFNQMKDRNDNLLLLEQNNDGGYRLKGKYFDFSSASGLEYVVNVSKPVGQKIKILGLSDGSYFYKDSTYHVALNSYRGSGGGGHLTKGVGLSKQEIKDRLIESSDNDLRYLLMKYIEKEKEVTVEAGSNWRIIPEDYFEWGKSKDYKLLFE